MDEQNTWIVNIDEDGIVTMPDDLIEQLGWKVGDILDYQMQEDGEIYITRVGPDESQTNQEDDESQDNE